MRSARFRPRNDGLSWWSEKRRGRNTQVGGPGKQGLLLKGCRTMIIETPLQLIFRDLFYRLPAFDGRHDVFLKLEGIHITGSIKVKTAIGLVEDLARRRTDKPNETVLVRSSSGHLTLSTSLISC